MQVVYVDLLYEDKSAVWDFADKLYENKKVVDYDVFEFDTIEELNLFLMKNLTLPKAGK